MKSPQPTANHIKLMGVLNVTPDSFADGGVFFDTDGAVRRAKQMVAEGADIIDIGGESTRPGASAVSVEGEIQRVVPVIEKLKGIDAMISIDTQKPEVMAAAVRAGAGMINDVNALRAPGALEMAATLNVSVCLMHRQGEPAMMQQDPQYRDVVQDVSEFLMARVRVCEAAGMTRDKLMIDPGFGFGKRPEHNLQLLNRLEKIVQLGFPVVVGWSRKATVGVVCDRPVGERLPGSLAAVVVAVQKGAHVIRTHDVSATRDAIRFTQAVMAEAA